MSSEVETSLIPALPRCHTINAQGFLDFGSPRNNVKFILFLSLPLYALDQLTKHWVLRSIGPYDARIVVPDFFNLVNVPNTGAAFGSFKGNNTFFVVISIIAIGRCDGSAGATPAV